MLAPPTANELACIKHLKENVSLNDVEKGDEAFLSEETYLRFTRARDADFGKALTMLKECVTWRRQFRPFAIEANELAGILQLGTVYLAGLCVHGRPVMYMHPGAKNPFPAETRVKLMVFLLEETMRRGYTSLTWVFDFSKMGERGKDEHSAATRKDTMHILQNYYPERLGALYMLNTPWYFRAIATLVWPFIDKRTRAKIFISMKLKNLTDCIAKDQLVEAFGGDFVLPKDDIAADPVAALEQLIPRRLIPSH
ncbi:Hypothetical protein, putative [Bodo saltans]|uniref:CRAL-TRIO domain-containing protein n=1 Tax=Bodo saltans TaxID=75058 RepID=A0A0S4JUF9_BODSA|nr:Hypothetical protein, putative [Bodo saltans]|eukprot:CUG94446.1 Hypothetical protein, putative [Bodo saltans]